MEYIVGAVSVGLWGGREILLQRVAMRKRIWAVLCVPAVGLLMAAANGAWLTKVPAADHATANAVAGHPDAIAPGSTLYQDNCAKCHGVEGNGRGSRPPVHSARIAAAKDGDLFWLLKNGQPSRGMPSWARLPQDQRWRIIAWLRSIQVPGANGGKP
jgi:mono/diheme cytochrome c family protein